MFPKLQVVIFVVCFTFVWLQLSFWLVLWLCFRVPLFEAIMMCQSGFQHIFDNVFFRVLCLRNIYSMGANGLNPIKSQNYRIILCIYINIYIPWTYIFHSNPIFRCFWTTRRPSHIPRLQSSKVQGMRMVGELGELGELGSTNPCLSVWLKTVGLN